MPALVVDQDEVLLGTEGGGGADGVIRFGEQDAGLAGGDAADGAAGDDAAIATAAASFTGTKQADSIGISLATTGGDGGNGGIGGDGGRAPLLGEVIGTPRSLPGYTGSLTDTSTTYGAAGDGGAGGMGGAGGAAAAIITGLSIRLGQEGSAKDSVALAASATGGAGGAGGGGGDGGTTYFDNGFDIWSGTIVTYLWDGVSAFDYGYTTTRLWGAGGDGGAQGPGGRGGDATGAIDAVTLNAREAVVALQAEARGGDGGLGTLTYSGSRGDATPGSGGTPGHAPDGGRGGDGGDALARVEALRASFLGAASVAIEVLALGGAGGQGGNGAGAGAAAAVTWDASLYGGSPLGGTSVPSGYDGTVSIQRALAGDGGDGGTGGDALARMAACVLTFDAGADNLDITLAATGGAGGKGGQGVHGGVAPSSETIQANGFYLLQEDSGLADSAGGAMGASGTGRIELLNNRIVLGDGADTLSLSMKVSALAHSVSPWEADAEILASLSAANLTASGNRFDGGLGTDLLDLSGIQGGAAVVDLVLGTLKVGGVTLGKLLGFEVFVGTAGADRFVDGAGDQVYAGGNDAVRDTLIFTVGHGHDVIIDFGAPDRIQLKGFGAAFDSFAELKAATHNIFDHGSLVGCVIDTPDGGSITLAGLAKAQLTAGMFQLIA